MAYILELAKSLSAIVLKKPDKALYQPLSDPDGVRLLAMQPGKGFEKITCVLSHVSLATTPDDEALSYTWGDNHKSHSIRCGNGFLPVTANLHSALQRFRYRDRPRTLWADAICINQADIPERNLQVRQMQRIYQQAREVFLAEVLNKSHVLTSPPDFAPEIKLPLSKLTATDNIMLGNHGQ
jgi:hypothetical protein